MCCMSMSTSMGTSMRMSKSMGTSMVPTYRPINQSSRESIEQRLINTSLFISLSLPFQPISRQTQTHTHIPPHQTQRVTHNLLFFPTLLNLLTRSLPPLISTTQHTNSHSTTPFLHPSPARTRAVNRIPSRPHYATELPLATRTLSAGLVGPFAFADRNVKGNGYSSGSSSSLERVSMYEAQRIKGGE